MMTRMTDYAMVIPFGLRLRDRAAGHAFYTVIMIVSALSRSEKARKESATSVKKASEGNLQKDSSIKWL